MLKIGEFAQLGTVSPKALRLYAQRGLLRPYYIDRFTGYRYYQPEQLARLHRILALKELGFSLEQIGELLDGELSNAALRALFRQQRAALETQIATEQARLARVEARLAELERDHAQPAREVLLNALIPKEKSTMEPQIVSLPAFQVTGLPYHGRNQNQEIKALWAQFNPRAAEIAHADGPFYGVCRDIDDDGALDYLAGRGVSAAEDVPQGMECWTVPANTYAVLPADLATIHDTYRHFFASWLPGSGYEHVPAPDFEYYGADFDGRTGEGLYIYLPVREK